MVFLLSVCGPPAPRIEEPFDGEEDTGNRCSQQFILDPFYPAVPSRWRRRASRLRWRAHPSSLPSLSLAPLTLCGLDLNPSYPCGAALTLREPTEFMRKRPRNSREKAP